MPIDSHDPPAEGLVLLGDRLDGHHRVGLAVNLQMIVVQDGHDIVEFVVSRFHGSFPDLSLLLLAIAHNAKDAVREAIEPARERTAYGDAQTLPQRARRTFHARQFQPMRMSLQRRTQASQQSQVQLIEEAGEGQSCIERWSLVSSRPEDAVAVGPGGISRVMFGYVEIQGGSNVHHRKGSACVSGARATKTR